MRISFRFSSGVGILAVVVLSALLVPPAAAAAENPAANPAKGPAVNSGEPAVIPGSYVVVLKNAAGVETTSNGLTRRHGGRVVRTFSRALRGFEMAGDAEAARAVAADPRVAYVAPNHRFRISETQTPTPSWGLDRIDQRTAEADHSYSYPNTAGTVDAYVIDTGIRFTHNDFEGRARSGFDAVDGGAADDCNGHGTHVSGTIGGSTYGVAKAVNLIGVRVLNCDGEGTTAQVVAGIDWVTADHAAGVPAVANMSVGGDVDQAIDDAVAGSIADGITYAVAAGNDDVDACLGSPARAPAAITVGASGPDDERASFSDFGRCVDIFAPGVDIKSSYYSSDAATETLSGTSMATPHVTGVAALLLSAHPSFSPERVRAVLVGTATKGVVTDAGPESPNVLLYVDNPPPTQDFSITVTPPTGAIDPGGSVTATVHTATTVGVAAPVQLSVSGLPADVTAAFTPATVTSGGSSVLRITAAATAGLGRYPLKIAGTQAGVMHKIPFELSVSGPAGCVVTSGSDLEIPDPGSAESVIPIRGCATAPSPLSRVEMHIQHSWVSDLEAHLIAPDGSDYPLLQQTGGGDDHLDLTLTVDLSGKVADGTWRLQIADAYQTDSGHLDSWTLDLGDPPATPGCTGTNLSDGLILDLGTVTSAIVISGCDRNGSTAAPITVHIVHGYVGDLVVTLLAPDGRKAVLHNRAGGPTEDIYQTYLVNLSSAAANGVWRLRVEDVDYGTGGYLDGWRITL
jgi:subtilisin family serine protease/subtilisin-like proprotein convertase family protein